MSILNKDYASIIEGKAVTLIGGASLASNIDYNNILVRCNTNYSASVFPVDVLYLSSAPNLDELQNNLMHFRLKYAWLNMNAVNTFLYADMCRKYKIPHAYYNRYTYESYKTKSTWVAKLQQMYDFLPLTGVIAMYHIMHFKPSSLFITGMDLYFDETTGRVPKQRDMFDLHKNARAIKALKKHYNGIITLDARLDYVLNTIVEDNL